MVGELLAIRAQSAHTFILTATTYAQELGTRCRESLSLASSAEIENLVHSLASAIDNHMGRLEEVLLTGSEDASDEIHLATTSFDQHFDRALSLLEALTKLAGLDHALLQLQASRIPSSKLQAQSQALADALKRTGKAKNNR